MASPDAHPIRYTSPYFDRPIISVLSLGAVSIGCHSLMSYASASIPQPAPFLPVGMGHAPPNQQPLTRGRQNCPHTQLLPSEEGPGHPIPQFLPASFFRLLAPQYPGPLVRRVGRYRDCTTVPGAARRYRIGCLLTGVVRAGTSEFMKPGNQTALQTFGRLLLRTFAQTVGATTAGGTSFTQCPPLHKSHPNARLQERTTVRKIH